MADTHFDVMYLDYKNKWAVIRHGNIAKKHEVYRQNKMDAIEAGEKVARNYIRKSPDVSQAEIHIYKKGASEPSRIKIVPN